MRIFLAIGCAGLALMGPNARAADEGERAIRESVVKIFATHRYPDPTRPWSKASPMEISGSGVIIEGKRILTNAHVALYASQIFVQPHESGDKEPATVEAIAPGIDLAVLKLDNASFFDHRPPLARTSQLPEIKDTALVYGYPQGGTSLSVTKGIVSRIEFAPYYYSTAGLRVQIDAAINPGNSGGPALVNDKMIGLIFSKLRESDNIGYIIPNEEIDVFLEDIKDGKYDGRPMVWDGLQTLENDALREKLKLDKKASGLVVCEPYRDDSDYPLKEWDLITRIGDHDIDNVGMVQVRDNLRLSFRYLVPKEAHDGKVRLSIIRDGQPLTIDLPVSTHQETIFPPLQGRYPSYFIYGPLVFSPATAEAVGAMDRIGGVLSFHQSPLLLRRGDKPKFEGEELVMVASRMFPHRIGKGYSDPFTQVVRDINGVKIRNLKHLVETLRDCKDDFIIIHFADKNVETLVFKRHEIEQATEEILTDNGIRRQYSDDLATVWEPKQRAAVRD
jgi:S1-C subfamily serine protease